MALTINTLIEYKTDTIDSTRVERILYMNPTENAVITIDVNRHDALPLRKTLTMISKFIAKKQAVVLERDPFAYLQDDHDRPQKQRDFRDDAWDLISQLVLNDDGTINVDIFYAKQRSRLIQQVVGENEKLKPRVYRYLRRFWQRGQTKNALLPDYVRSGGKGKEREQRDRKLGRPSTAERERDIRGIPLTKEIKEIFRRAIKLYYKRGATLGDVFQEVIDKNFSSGFRLIDGVAAPIHLPVEKQPSFRQFEYFFHNEWKRDVGYYQKRMHGEKRFNKDLRGITGTSVQMAVGPGHVFQMDSTILDVYLVSSLDRASIVGRPILYVIIDVFSRLITGFCIALEGPSWNAARFALENMVCDKVEFCRRFGIEIEENEWPAHHLPFSIISDRGESFGKNGSDLPENLGIVLSTAAPFRPDWKPFVERHFRLINDEAVKTLPSYVRKDKNRGERDPRLDASLTPYEIRKILTRLFVYYNNSFELKNLRYDDLLIPDHVEPYPAEIWNWGLITLHN